MFGWIEGWISILTDYSNLTCLIDFPFPKPDTIHVYDLSDSNSIFVILFPE